MFFSLARPMTKIESATKWVIEDQIAPKFIHLPGPNYSS